MPRPSSRPGNGPLQLHEKDPAPPATSAAATEKVCIIKEVTSGEEDKATIRWLSEHFILRDELQMEIAKQLTLLQRVDSFTQAEVVKQLQEEQAQRGDPLKEVTVEAEGSARRGESRRGVRLSTVRCPGVTTDTEYSVAESVWDTVLFIGTPEIGLTGSVLASLLLLMNILTQVICIFTIQISLLSSDFDEDSLQGLRAWRYQVGHDLRLTSTSNGFSLVDRVCSGDPTLELATKQSNILEMIQSYLPDEHRTLNGPAMCMLAVFIWSMVCLREFNQTMDFMRAVAELPRATGKDSMFQLLDSGRLELREVHSLRRVSVLFVACVRLAVVGTLLMVGTLYLINTISISVLILNAVALELVIHVDELIFTAAMPMRVVALVRRLSPLRVSPLREHMGVDVKAIAAPLFLFAVLIWVRYWPLGRLINDIQEAKRVLCGGNRTFGFELDGLQVVRIQDLPAYDREAVLDPTDPASAAVQEVSALHDSGHKNTFLPAGIGVTFIIQDPMDRATTEHMIHTVEDLRKTELNHTCSDENFWRERRDKWLVMQRSLSQALRLGPDTYIENCSQVQPHCLFRPGLTHRAMAFVRAVCPETCGCHSLLKGTIFVAPQLGCPRQCVQSVDDLEWETATCKDLNMTDPGDERAASLRLMMKEVLPFTMANPIKGIADVSALFEVSGCELVTLVRQKGLGDLCRPVDRTFSGHLFDGEAMQGTQVKLMTFFCPKTCNCDGARTDLYRPPTRLCPRSCI